MYIWSLHEKVEADEAKNHEIFNMHLSLSQSAAALREWILRTGKSRVKSTETSKVTLMGQQRSKPTGKQYLVASRDPPLRKHPEKLA